MKKSSLSQKHRSTHSSSPGDNEAFVAEELESRVLFSAAPPVPVEAPTEEVTSAAAESENTAGNFESIDGFVQDGAPDLPELNEILEELDEVSLVNLDNLTEEEIATLRESNISLANLATSAAPAEDETAGEDAPQSETLGLDLIESQLSEVAAASEVTDIGLPATLDTGALVPSQVVAEDESEELTLGKLLEVGEAARQRWIETGLTAEQVAALDNIEYRIADLAPTRVGMTEGNVITIDSNAAERGWFIDETPLEDEEFTQTGETTYVAHRGTEAAQDIDLVTVVMHEQGHILGLLDESSFDQDEALMYAYIAEGQRRVAGEDQAEAAEAGSLEGEHYLSTLAAGDIAIVAFNFDNADALAFVALENIDAGAEISFTDNGWRSSGSFRANEGTFTWTAPSNIAAGTVVTPAVSSVAFSGSGDQILAYQGTSGSPTFIYALNSEGSSWQANATTSNTSALPSGLVDGTSAVAMDPERDNGYYSGTTSGTKAELLAAIGDPTNWTTSNSRIAESNWPSSFTVTGSATPGITLSKTTADVTEGGATASFTIALDTNPSADVTITITPDSNLDLGSGAGVAINQVLNTTTAANITVTAVDDDVDEASPHTGNITFSVASTDGDYDGFTISPVTVNITDDDTAGFTLSESSLQVGEGVSQATFTVALTSEPTHDVVFDVASNDLGEASASPAQLTFTSADWDSPQTVTVTGVDDALIDGNVASTVTVSINNSTDPNFADLAAQQVNVTTLDDDAPGITLSKASATVSEDGVTTDTFTVRLNSQPATDVVLNLSSGDTGEVTVSPASLTFTDTNWNVEQTVTLTGVNDAIDDGDQNTDITISVDEALSDNSYDALADETVSVTTTDDDTAGFTPSKTTATVSEDGTTTLDSFDVVLDAEPLGTVTINIANPGTDEVTASAASLVFNSGNWNVAQTVNLTGVDDADDDGDVVTNLTLSVNPSSDSAFTALASQDVSVTTTDDDGPVVIAVEDFDGGTPAWTNDIASQEFVDPSSSNEGLFIQGASSDNSNFSGNSAFSRDLGGESGEPTLSPFTFTFDSVDVSAFENVTVSFDFAAFANADAASYELIVDGVGQGTVEFFNDPDSATVSGTITEVVGTASTVGLQLTGTLNGGSDTMELDNFLITGTPAALEPDIAVLGGASQDQDIADDDGSPATPSLTDGTDFGTIEFASGSQVNTFTISNTGLAELSVTSVVVSDTTNYTVGGNLGSGGAVGTGSSDTFTITFDPDSAGAKPATVTITSNDPDGTEGIYTFAITGTGALATAPEINVTGDGQTIVDGETATSAADHTDFGTTTTNGVLTRTFTIENTGTADLDLTGATPVTLTGDGEFTVTTQPLADPVGQGTSTTFVITYTPTTATTNTATVSIASNDADEDPYTFAIEATAIVAPAVTINEVRHSGSGGPPEFLEVFGPANTTLTGLTLVQVFDETTAAGDLNLAIDLSSVTTDADGFAMIHDSTLTGDGGDLSIANLDLSNAPSTYLIVEGYTGPLGLSLTGTDTDTNDDGTFDAEPWTSVVDSVSFIDGDGNTDFSHSATVVGPDGSFTPAGAARDVNGTGTFSQSEFGSTADDTPGATNDGVAPTLSALSPADDSLNVAVDSNLQITLSEDVALASTGTIAVYETSGNGLVESFDLSLSPAGVTVLGDTVTIDLTSDLANGTEYYVQISNGAIEDLNGNAFTGITDTTSWSFTTAPAVDNVAPNLAVTDPLSPADDDTGVAVDADLTITFDENVQAGTGNITLTGGPSPVVIDVTDTNQVTFSGATVTINPTADLESDTAYSVQIDSTAITDTSAQTNAFAGIADTTTWNFTTAAPVATFVRINEVNASNPSTDDSEFIELYDGGAGNTPLDGLVVVLYNGNGDSSYDTIVLDGHSTDADGFFVIGSSLVTNVDLTDFTSNSLQNGTDAVALYVGTPADSSPTTTNLVDAIVYGSSDDAALRSALGLSSFIDEGDNTSASRSPDGTGDFVEQTPTPGIANINNTPAFAFSSSDSRVADTTFEVTVDEDAGAQTITDFVTGITPGTGESASQTVSFTVTTTNDDLFASAPALVYDAGDGTANLTFTPADDANGFAEIVVTADDDFSPIGSSVKVFRITVNPITDNAAFTLGGDPGDDDGRNDPFAQAGFQALINRIHPGAQGVIIKSLPAATNGILSQTGGSDVNVDDEIPMSELGNLIFTPETGGSSTWNGTLRFEYAVRNGDGSGGLTVIFGTQSSVEANLTHGANVEVNQGAGSVTIPGFGRLDSGDIDRSSLFFELSSAKPGLFSQSPSLDLDGTLQFTPAPDASGISVVTANLTDGIRSYGAQSFLIRVNAFSPNPGIGVGGVFSSGDSSGLAPLVTQSLVFDLLNRDSSGIGEAADNAKVTLAFFGEGAPTNSADAVTAFLGGVPNTELGTVLIFNDLSEFHRSLKAVVDGQNALDFRVLDLSQFIGGDPGEKAVLQAREKTFRDDGSESSGDTDDEAAPEGDPSEATDGAETNQDDGRPGNDLLETSLDLVKR